MDNFYEEGYTHVLLREKSPVAKFHSRAAAEEERRRMQRVSLQLGRTQDRWIVAAVSKKPHELSDREKGVAANRARYEAELEKSREAYRRQLERRRKGRRRVGA